MTTYSLTKQARECKGRGTHLTAALEALKAVGGKTTGTQIADYVEEKKLLKTAMDTPAGHLLDYEPRGPAGAAEGQGVAVRLRPVVGPIPESSARISR
jgi:hypothetical protein